MSTQTFRPQRTRSISSAPSKTMPSNRIIRLGRGRFFFILYFNSISFRFFSATNCWAMAAGCDDVETVALFFISGRFFFLQKNNNNNNKQQNQAISLASSTSKRTNQRFTSRRFCGNTAASHWPTMGRPTNQRHGNRPRAAGQTKDERFTGQQPKNNKSIITKQRPNIKVILGFHDRYGHGLHFV